MRETHMTALTVGQRLETLYPDPSSERWWWPVQHQGNINSSSSPSLPYCLFPRNNHPLIFRSNIIWSYTEHEYQLWPSLDQYSTCPGRLNHLPWARGKASGIPRVAEPTQLNKGPSSTFHHPVTQPSLTQRRVSLDLVWIQNFKMCFQRHKSCYWSASFTIRDIWVLNMVVHAFNPFIQEADRWTSVS